MSRSVIYGVACSLDGFIAGPNGEVDWLRWSTDVAAIAKSVFERIDTVLMGRKTYEVGVLNGLTAYPDVKNVVFSRSVNPERWPAVSVVNVEAVDYVSALKQEPGADICVIGGGELAGSLIKAGLVDEIGMNVHPVILGAGIPLLSGAAGPHELELVEAREIEGGCVYLMYRFVRAETKV
jgi:dihydrofolate reductase